MPGSPSVSRSKARALLPNSFKGPRLLPPPGPAAAITGYARRFPRPGHLIGWGPCLLTGGPAPPAPTAGVTVRRHRDPGGQGQWGRKALKSHRVLHWKPQTSSGWAMVITEPWLTSLLGLRPTWRCGPVFCFLELPTKLTICLFIYFILFVNFVFHFNFNLVLPAVTAALQGNLCTGEQRKSDRDLLIFSYHRILLSPVFLPLVLIHTARRRFPGVSPSTESLTLLY